MNAATRLDVSGIVALFDEHATIVGVGECKGEPCTTPAEIRDRFAANVLMRIDVVVTRSEEHQVWADWRAAYPRAALPRGAEYGRGSLTIIAEDGRIKYFAMRYDLADPETVLIRATQDDVSFALQGADGVSNTTQRVLLTKFPTSTAITVYLDDRVRQPTGLAVAIHRGTCARVGPEAYRLNPFENHRSDTLIPVPGESFFAADFAVVLRQPDGSALTCGKIPRGPAAGVVP